VSARPIPPRPGAAGVSGRLGEMLRVDHAGEVAAVQIYRGHRAVFEAAGMADAARRMGEFEAHEAAHLQRFETLLTEKRVRPTLMAPLWRAAAFGLGVGAALIGEKAAHACTEAVETVIEDHNARQIAELEGRDESLAAELSAFRADELAHREEAINEGAREAPLYGLLSFVVRAGCRAAIKVSERI
jgi:ubiquinone biosynthesis monooxygenase Coq7